MTGGGVLAVELDAVGFKEQLLRAQRYGVTYVRSFGAARVDKWLHRHQVWVVLPHLIY